MLAVIVLLVSVVGSDADLGNLGLLARRRGAIFSNVGDDRKQGASIESIGVPVVKAIVETALADEIVELIIAAAVGLAARCCCRGGCSRGTYS